LINDNFNNYYDFDKIDYYVFKEMNEFEYDSKDISSIERQGRRPGRPGRPNRPGAPNRPGGPPERPGPPDRPRPPRDRRPPTMPPPRIIPSLPRGFVIPLSGTVDYDTQFRNSNRRRDRISQFIYCLNSFTFVWLWNGRTFWFYPTYIDWRSVEGFVWRNGNWYYHVLNINDIFFFNCF